MADENVSGAQFGEFVKRMEDRFDHAEELARVREEKLNLRFNAIEQRFDAADRRMEQGFVHAEKAREQNFVHMNQRFDDMNQGVNLRFDGLEKRLDDLWKIMVAGCGEHFGSGKTLLS